MVIRNIADMDRFVRELDAERDARNAPPTKSCFVISPIGEEGSEVRIRSDQILKYVIQPAAREFGYATVRADAMPEPGLITSQIIDRIISDDLVVADLTGRNPNVYYELAIRHAIRKPFIQLIQAEEKLPFDIVGMRTIPVNHRDLDSVAKALEDLKRQIASIESSPTSIQTPISVAIDVTMMRRSERPEDRAIAEMMTMLSDIKAQISDLQPGGATDARTARPVSEQRRWPNPSANDTFGLVEVLGEELNRRDAQLRCGYCGQGPVQMHFYEGDGEPKLLDVLGLFHYWDCAGLGEHPHARILLVGPGREPVFLTWRKPPQPSDSNADSRAT